MRLVKIGLMVVFILSAVLFGVSEILELKGRDPDAPEIVSDRDVLEIPCAYTMEQLMEGVSASDEQDGDLTDQIAAGAFSRFTEAGVADLTYVVFDSAGQSASLTREVRFTDYHGPRFTLTEPLVFAEGEGSYTETMARLGAEDQLDGSRTEWIVQTDTDVNYSSVGNYTVSVEVTNSFGDTASADLPVHVVNAQNRNVRIALTGGIVYLTAGEAIDPASYVAGVTDTAGNALDPGTVSIESGVDVNTPGCYEIHYQAADAAGNTGETWLTVIVEGGE